MRLLFLISDTSLSARARAFVLAARGLKARGHEVALVCESECSVQVRAAQDEIPVVSLQPDASAAGNTLELRRALQERDVDVVFVHTDEEHLIAGSAVRLGRRTRSVIRRLPPFAIAARGASARIATRLAPAGLLFSTEADLRAADVASYRIPSALAPPGIDVSEHDGVRAATQASLGVPPDARLIVCVHDHASKHRALVPLRTLALLAPRHPELHLAFTGAGRQDELRMQGAALGVNTMVSYLGARADELSVLRAADVGWLAAEGDAAVFAAMDFMAFGTPILAERDLLTEHYVADGIGGVLLAPDDTSTTAASVAAFLAKDEQRVAMGNAGRSRLLRDFPYDAMIDGFEQAARGAAGQSELQPANAPSPQPVQ